MKKNYVIVVNGPGSSGKSSAALEVAKSLGFSFLSTGNVYRSYAWALQKEGIQKYVKNKCIEIMQRYKFEYYGKSIFYKDKDIAKDLGYEELALKAASLAQKSWYRDWINTNIILPYVKNKSIVLEGRGLTEIVPNPDVDFFLKSTIFARANRRLRQYVKRYGIHDATLDNIYKQIKKRDSMDINRKLAPLRPNPNSKVINNSMIKRVDTVRRMLFIVHKRFPELKIDWKVPGTTK
ncbi:MAG: (d)CMP kinase [Mycoplasmataceae bacterium]|nr:(d)CMP kinase [Mycoplasmataceae bacterium]